MRSIARDLGLSLQTCAHLCGLVRTSAGALTLADCVELDELAERGAELVAKRMLDPVAVLGLPARAVDIAEVVDIYCGRQRAPASPSRARRSPSSGTARSRESGSAASLTSYAP